MRLNRSFRSALAALIAGVVCSAVLPPAAWSGSGEQVAAQFMRVDRSTPWTPVAAIKLGFKTYHPQGMVKVGEVFFLSAVEIVRAPKMFATPQGGYDRDSGAGIGHLFKFAANGALLAQTTLGEGDAYHPGGIDFDGHALWVPTAEYRPDSRSILYAVDPESLRAKPVLRFDDHIGGLAYDRKAHRLHGLSWGSRRLYSWAVGPGGRIGAAKPTIALNPEAYVDYQDCHAVLGHRMLCSGVADYAGPGGSRRFQLGGIDLVDLTDGRPIWQVPIDLHSPSGRVMTQNPFFVEATAGGVRAYFIPDDDDSTLFIFDADTDIRSASSSRATTDAGAVRRSRR